MKAIAITLFIALSCMAMESILAKYLLVDLDQTKTGTKSLNDHKSTKSILLLTKQLNTYEYFYTFIRRCS